MYHRPSHRVPLLATAEDEEATMGIGELAGFLGPFIPYLIDKGRTFGETAVSAVQAEAWEFAKRIWDRLGEAVGARPEGQAAAEEVARDPGDEQALAAFQEQIDLLLAEDARLAEHVAALLATPEAAAVEVSASRGSFAAGGDVKDSQIVIGNQNRIGG